MIGRRALLAIQVRGVGDAEDLYNITILSYNMKYYVYIYIYNVYISLSIYIYIVIYIYIYSYEYMFKRKQLF